MASPSLVKKGIIEQAKNAVKRVDWSMNVAKQVP